MGDPVLENRGLTHACVDFLGGKICFGVEDQKNVPCAQAGQGQNQAVGQVLSDVSDPGEFEDGLMERPQFIENKKVAV